MGDLVGSLRHRLGGHGLLVGGSLTVGLFVGSIVLATAVVVGWSPDHFVAGRRPLASYRHPVARLALVALRNLGGVVLVALGIAMALPAVPGQGLLTILIGLTLVDFPGKRRIETWLLGRKHVARAINRLRARFGRQPLIVK